MVAGTLGCGAYDVHVMARGGATLVATVPWTSLSWSRVLDETSGARVSGVVDPSCCELLRTVRPWRHEVGVYRDRSLVWAGPVVAVRWPPEGIEIEARDLTAWWDRRRVHADVVYATPTDLATIFQAIADDAMSVDASPGLTVTTQPSGVLGTRSVLALAHQMAGAVLRELTETGIDWTTVARQVLAGGIVVPATAIGTLLDAHCATPPTPVVDGGEQANDWTVRGQGGGAAGDAVFGTAAAPAATIAADGRLEAVATASEIADAQSATEQARSRLSLTGEGYVSVERCALAQTAPFAIADLVPGALLRAELVETCLPVSGDFRLQRVAVDAQGDGEFVVLTLQPAGTSDVPVITVQ